MTSFKAIFLIFWHRYGLDDSQQPNKVSHPHSGDVYYREKNGVSRPETSQSPNDLETGRPHPPHFVDDEDLGPSGSMRAKNPLELAVEKNARNGNAYELVELPLGAKGEVNSAF